MEDEILDLGFGGIEPAVFGSFVALPKGEYQLQCTGVKKFFTGESKGTPDPNKPNLSFSFTIINHPNYAGQDTKDLNHSLNEKSRPFLLNTLMCLIPEVDWQQDGIKVPISQLIKQVTGRTVNGTIDWEINAARDGSGKSYVNNNLKGLKKYDPAVPPPMASEGNPPIINNSSVSPSPVAQKAAAGVSPDEVNAFLGNSNVFGSNEATNASSFEPF